MGVAGTTTLDREWSYMCTHEIIVLDFRKVHSSLFRDLPIFTVSLHTGWMKSSHQVWNIFFIYLYSILIFCSNIVLYIFIFYFYPIYTIFLYVLTIDILFIHLNKTSKLSIFNVVYLNVIIFFIDFFFILLSFFAYNSYV
jgi:hypothetical protein